MKSFEKVTEFDFRLNKDTVFHLIDCKPGSPIYEEIEEEYKQIEAHVMQLIKPRAFYKFGCISEETAKHAAGNLKEGNRVIFTLMTMGDEIARLSSDYFASGDYLLGMLVNAMADTYLFQMDDELKCFIKESCAARHVGVEKRLDAPEQIPMIVQKDILDEIKENEKLSIDVTEGYMFTTVKTMGYILVLSEDESTVYAGHNCSACSDKKCKLRSRL